MRPADADVPAASRVHPALVGLHWVIAVLFALAIAGIVLRSLLPSGHALRPPLRTAHIGIGQAILVLAVVRVVVRWRTHMPAAASVAPWATWAGRSVHGLLYAVMLTQPISGIVFQQAGDKSVHFLGWTLPRLVASDTALAAGAKDLHLLTGNIFYGLVLLHVAAALWHHFVLRNETLRRMLPRRGISGAVGVAPTQAQVQMPVDEPRPAELARAAIERMPQQRTAAGSDSTDPPKVRDARALLLDRSNTDPSS